MAIIILLCLIAVFTLASKEDNIEIFKRRI